MHTEAIFISICYRTQISLDQSSMSRMEAQGQSNNFVAGVFLGQLIQAEGYL